MKIPFLMQIDVHINKHNVTFLFVYTKGSWLKLWQCVIDTLCHSWKHWFGNFRSPQYCLLWVNTTNISPSKKYSTLRKHGWHAKKCTFLYSIFVYHYSLRLSLLPQISNNIPHICKIHYNGFFQLLNNS